LWDGGRVRFREQYVRATVRRQIKSVAVQKVRKQVYDLTHRDLAAHAVWEFALDEEGDEGQDEATVRPFTADAVDPTAGMFIVRASFTLNDGTKRSGYLTPPSQGDASLGAIQPVIVTEQGQVSFWLGVVAPTPDQLAANYELLRSGVDGAFPIRYQSDVPSTCGVISGTIAGFSVLEDFASNRVGTVR
jgi:hypothetical protein